jgi:putative ABC transport system substrate-binding protein
LAFGNASTWSNRVEALRSGLRDLGDVEGKNIIIEFRATEAIDQLQGFATEFVRMDVDLIFAPSSTETEVARQATDAIPIVFATHADPVGLGTLQASRVQAATSQGSPVWAPTLQSKDWNY